MNSSKAVDENGEPLVVYHGSKRGSFDRLIFVKDGKASLLKQNTAGAAYATAHRTNNIAKDGGLINREGAEGIPFQREASLLGIHNLSADNIRHALKMGGQAQRRRIRAGWYEPIMRLPDFRSGRDSAFTAIGGFAAPKTTP